MYISMSRNEKEKPVIHQWCKIWATEPDQQHGRSFGGHLLFGLLHKDVMNYFNITLQPGDCKEISVVEVIQWADLKGFGFSIVVGEDEKDKRIKKLETDRNERAIIIETLRTDIVNIKNEKDKQIQELKTQRINRQKTVDALRKNAVDKNQIIKDLFWLVTSCCPDPNCRSRIIQRTNKMIEQIHREI